MIRDPAHKQCLDAIAADAVQPLMPAQPNGPCNCRSFELRARTAETQDAERYRYLRDAAGMYAGDEDGPTICDGAGDLFNYLHGPECDEVIDDAISRWKAGGCPLPPKEVERG